MTWYLLDIIFEGEHLGEIRRHTVKNLDGSKLRQFRETVFISGLYIQDPDNPLTQGEIIAPARLRKIDVFMQSKKFE